MRLDPVHDLQRVFRKLLAATASPGTVVELADEAELLDLELPLNKGVVLVALVLLDAETTFCLSPHDSTGTRAKAISQMTYSRQAPRGEADFLFTLGTEGAAQAIVDAKAGSLVDPHLGATIVVEVEFLREGGPLELSGPGIEASSRLEVGLDPSWIAARASKNLEFPLGVDLIFVDRSFRIAALPRTTRVREAL